MTNNSLSHQLCYSFYQVNRLFNQFYKEALLPFELTYTQYLVLLCLWEQDGLSLQSIGKQLGLASNTLTPLLKRLEDRGWIVRCRPEQNKRQLFIHLTDKGRTKQALISEQLAHCFMQLPDLTPEIVQNLLLAHQHVQTALQSRTHSGHSKNTNHA